ncbi:MAG: protein-S-isoprenylcysteine O-methyltransferase Ste14 [Desulforhopalus sp.]
MDAKNLITENPLSMPKNSMRSYLIMALSGLTGGVSLVLFIFFLYVGLPSYMDFGLDARTSLYINTLLCLLFFLQHSLMIREGFRKWLSGPIPQNYHGAFFSIFSGLFLLLLMSFWQKSTSIQIELAGMFYWFIRSLFFIAIVGLFLTIRSLRFFDLLGIRDMISFLKGNSAKGVFFTVRGPYRWVRHPIYFFCLLMIWAQVSLTTDRLLFNGLWTVWIITGTFLEERDLVASFGDVYRNYQRKVPVLVPYKWLPWKQHQH